jgi:hypothetical protein
MKKTLNRSKLGLNKDSLRKIADDQLREVVGGFEHTVSATCSSGCFTFTIILDGGTCK